MLMKKLVAGAATTAIALSIGAIAHAQSTAGQAQEVIVTGSRAVRSTGGQAVQINEAKDEAVITKEFIASQVPSANFAQLINLVPGVTYSTEDPAGFNSGDLRIHGFDGNHVAVVLDGVPLNDTGNYAVFPGEYVIGEQVERTTVNIGSSDVDSPSASALGATVNITTKTPPKTFGGLLKFSGGSYGYGRAYGELDSGAIGPWGTTASIGGEYGTVDNFERRPGGSKRWNVNGKIYQPLSGSDFISIAGLFTHERQFPAFRVNQTQINALGRFYFGDNYTWVPEIARPGLTDTVPSLVLPNGTGGTTNSSDTNYYRLFSNPVDFGIIHGQSKFTLARGLIFTFDPSFFYTLANGGGGGNSLSETNARLIGNANNGSPVRNSHACSVAGRVTGVDLNGDGDCQDTVVIYQPSNTQTYRYGLTSSLLYDFSEQHHFQISYTYDLGRHRQTGEATFVDPNTGNEDDVFGAKVGYGRPIATADGSSIRSRDRYSIAQLNQISANYIGKFLDDRLHVNLGVRAPFFERNLDQHCFTFNGSNALCDSIDPALVQTAFNTDRAANRAPGSTASALTAVLGSTVATGQGGVPNFRFPFKATFKFDDVLPNAGATYRLFENHLFYVSYARGFSAPKTDNLYTSSTDLVQPETSDNYAIGYRYQTRSLNVSLNFYDTEYKNRIVQSIDPNDPTLSIDRNVGNARVDGIDIEAGWNPIEHLHIYSSANFNESELKANIPLSISGVIVPLPTKGKELVLTPDQSYSTRVTYDLGPIRFGVQGKYISSRFISDVNDAKVPGYATFGFDARVALPWFEQRSFVQLNVSNVFNRYYFSRSTTANNFSAVTVPGGVIPAPFNPPAYNIGAPSTFYLTLGTTF